MSRIVSEIIFCENHIHQFFLNQKIGSLLKRSNITKSTGIFPVAVFRILVTASESYCGDTQGGRLDPHHSDTEHP